MNRMSNSKRVTTGLAAVFAIGLFTNIGTVQSSLNANCECSATAPYALAQTDAFKQACSTKTKETVSWFDWIGGKSPSYQFHFLDLLELLYDDEESSNDAMPKSGGAV